MSTLFLKATVQRSILHHSDKSCKIAKVHPEKDIQHRHHPCVILNKARIHRRMSL